MNANMNWLMLLVLLLTGCNTESQQTARTAAEPEPAVMPEKIPDNFNFSLEFGPFSRNEINTFTETVTKDLITEGTATANLSFSDAEMAEIYDRMREIDIAETKTLIPDTNCMQEPHGTDRWKIKIHGETITHDWSGMYCEMTDDARELIELRNEIWQMVKKKPAYQQLPVAEGAYE